MAGLVLLGFLIIIGSVGLLFEEGISGFGFIGLLFLIAVFVQYIFPTIVIGMKIYIKKHKLSPEEGYKKTCKMITEPLAVWGYMITLDDWFWKKYGKDVEKYVKKRK